jgi:uncharacterized protein (TIGR02996 family)
MNDEAAFLQAMQERPDDSSLRLIFADWLEERGDSRGEYLRLSAALASLHPADERWHVSEARLKELRPTIDPGWLALIELRLPEALVTFLAEGKQLTYDPEDCEAGAVTLPSLPELKLERFPVETSGSSFRKQDPHYPGLHSYLVLGVNLTVSCTGDYEAVGLLIWLPIERRFAVWDSSHCRIQVFGPDITWEQIAAAPVPHIEAGWTGFHSESPPMEEFVPWLAHPYGDEQVYEPQPAEPWSLVLHAAASENG